MECAEAKSKMESYASDRLAADQRADLEQHLMECEGCRLEVELVRAMGSAPPKSQSGEGDEWTIDRIFGSGAARAPEAVPSASVPATPAAPADAPAEVPADAPASPSTAPSPVAPGPFGPPESVASPSSPANSSPVAVDALFEKTLAPPPPEPASPPAAEEHSPVPSAPASPNGADSMPGGMQPATAGPAAGPAAVSDESETSFADLKLESIEASSIAEPEPPAGGKSREASPEKAPGSRAGKAAPPQRGTSWEFEPADARPGDAPPEGSLFFAEEALTRQATARKGRSSTLRTALWAAGSVVGLALLVLSIWIAVGMRRPSQTPSAISIRRPPAANPGSQAEPTPQAPSSAEAAPAGEPPVDASPAPGAGAPEAPGAGAPSAPGAQAPAAAGAPRVIEAGALQATSASPAAPGKGTAPPAKAAPPPAKGASVPAKVSAAPGAASPAPKRAAPDAPVKPVITKLERSLPLGGVPAEEEPEETTQPAPPRADARPSGTTAAPPSPAPAVVAPPSSQASDSGDSRTEPVAAPGAPAPTPAPAAPSEPAVERPIDRLHLATVKAARDSDLDTLHKLRDTWKSLVRSSVGPDRSRGKRELADCLWEIQTLTGKDSDKKEALLAYREFVLTAPAGGADARTVARMRQLEDAMAESH